MITVGIYILIILSMIKIIIDVINNEILNKGFSQEENIITKIPVYIECKDKKNKYYINKEIIRLIKTYSEETDYIIQINYLDSYDVLIFKNEKERDEEYIRILAQMSI